ncbi:aminotransferase class I/II-fold pyridoxal phosphate-dependent enzyme [bacterium]|nr:aminotransferase class I/II-fold pyridoxal phosphate-dependent enzyme [bacterium]
MSREGEQRSEIVEELRSWCREAREAGSGLFDLSMINPDMSPARELLDRFIEASLKPNTHRYTAARGLKKLRDAFQELYRTRFGVEVESNDEICVMLGAKDATYQIMSVLSADSTLFDGEPSLGDALPLRRMLLPSPTYPALLTAAKLIGRYEIVFYRGESDAEALEDITEVLSDGVPTLVVLNSPNNPTGKIFSSQTLKEIVALVQLQRGVVINDFVYGEMGYEGVAPSLLSASTGGSVPYDGVLEIYSMSKAYSIPGWRVGAVVGDRRLVAALAKRKSYTDYGTFSPLQIGAASGLRSSKAITSPVTETYARRAALVVDVLTEAGCSVSPPEGGASVWLKLPESYPLDASAFARALVLDAGVVILPGEAFGREYARHFRIALVQRESVLRECAERMAGVLQERASEQHRSAVGAGKVVSLFGLALFTALHLVCSPGAVAAESGGERSCKRAVTVVQRLDEAGEQLGVAAKEALYEEAIRLCPEMSEIRYNYGVFLSTNGDPSGAREQFEQSCQQEDRRECRLAIARTYLSEENYSEAQQLYDDILKQEPLNPKALQGLAVIQERSGDLTKASELLARSVAVDPRDPVALFNLGALYHRKKLRSEALAQYEKVLAVKPNHFGALFYGALLRLEGGEFLEGVRLLERAARLHPDNPEVYRALGNAQERRGRLQKAELAFRRALDLEQGDVASRVNLAIVLGRLQRTAEVIEILEETKPELLQKRKRSARPTPQEKILHEGAIVLGRAYRKRGEAQLAEELLLRAHRNDPRDLRPLQELIQVSAEAGQHDVADSYREQLQVLQSQ